MLTKTDIERYFLAEKQAGFLFLIIGIIAVIIAVLLLIFFKNNFWKGFAIPLIIIGLIQGVVGYNIYSKSDKDRVNNVYAFGMNPHQLKEKELPRMQLVNKKFKLFKLIEVGLILIGLVVLFRYKNYFINSVTFSNSAFAVGFAIAIIIQSLIMLSADYFAEKRAIHYFELLSQFVNKKI